MIKKTYPSELKEAAKKSFVQGYSVDEIAGRLSIGKRSLYNWIKDEAWEELLPTAVDPVELNLARRLNFLINKADKSDSELKELDVLCGAFGNLSINKAKADKLKAEAIAISKGVIIPVEKTQRQYDKKDKKKTDAVKNDISKVSQESILAFIRLVLTEY